jgi:hypothetical protein
MAAFTYPPGWPGTITGPYVPGPDEYQAIWDNLVKAINSEGGTWAPGVFITIGGAGFEFAGTGHTIKASGRINVAPGAEILLPDTASAVTKPTIRVNGSNGAILLYVEAHASKLEVESGAIVQLNHGSFLNLLGALTLVGGGPGTLTAQNGTTATFQSGAQLALNAGSVVNASGHIDFNSGSTVEIKSGSIWQLQAGGQLAMAGSISVTGEVTYSANNWPKLTTRTWTRHSFDIALTTFAGGTDVGPDDPDVWVEKSNQGDAPCMRTRPSSSSGQVHVVEFCDLPPGGVLTGVDVTTRGGESELPVYPTYRIVRWQDGSDNFTSLSDLTTDIHDVTGDWNTENQTTELTTNTTVTVDKAYRYGLRVFHPYSAIGNYMRIIKCVAQGTLGKIQNA